MNRSTYLMAALVLAAVAAVGAYLWLQASGRLPPSMTASSPSAEAQLVAQMNEIAAGGGFAATFAEKEIRKWQITDGHRLERFSLDDASLVMARVSSDLPVSPQNLLSGLSILLPVEFAQKANGRRIEIGLVGRMPSTNPAGEVSVVYATLQAGNSGWQSLKLSPRFELRTFTFEVPYVESGYHSEPTVVIHADEQGRGRAVELLGIYVKVLAK